MINVGVIGLGKMGGPIAKKLKAMACELVVYDIDPAVQQEFRNNGFTVAQNIEDLSAKSTIIWVMVSARAVDSVLDQLCACTVANTVIIDGGNSYFRDTLRRGEKLEAKDLRFLDCGTSGGLWGAEHGFSMTVGGDYAVFKRVEEVFKYLAASPHAYMYTGPLGSGHYVKMVHNGIEYALLEAYAEGFHLLHNGYYKHFDLAAISKTWLEGAIIRSWILKLAHDVLIHDQDLSSVNGAVGENGTGRWMVEEAHKEHVPVKVIEDAVEIRKESRKTGGNYATKLIALIRHYMGGHPVAQALCDLCTTVR
jgi:6-phosphogluconate dehydrogenase